MLCCDHECHAGAYYDVYQWCVGTLLHTKSDGAGNTDLLLLAKEKWRDPMVGLRQIIRYLISFVIHFYTEIASKRVWTIAVCCP